MTGDRQSVPGLVRIGIQAETDERQEQQAKQLKAEAAAQIPSGDIDDERSEILFMQ